MARRWILGAALCLPALLMPAPAVAQPDLGTEEERALGEEVYAKWCAQCHGDDGAGQGIATPYLMPAPRDFTSAKYQVRSTPTGFLPTDDDIRRVIREGVPGTTMPGFPGLRAREVKGLVAYLKSFSDDFEDPAAYAEPIPIPDPPAFDEDNLEEARQVYQDIGCALCHGDEGRGDGASAPTMVDDWGQFVRPADLTRPWTFNGGPTREDVYRSISTGLTGTPMAGFADGLTEEQRWQIVDFVTAISEGKTEPGYANLAVAKLVEGEIDLEDADELFEEAPRALFPVFGQIVEPGRSFHPSVIAVELQAVYNRVDVALRVRWHDIQANTRGTNSPDIQVSEDELELFAPAAAEPEDEGADDEDFWGVAAAEEEPAEDEDFWGETAAGEDVEDDEADDFWGTPATAAGDEAGPPAADVSEWSDAVAIQLPAKLPEGIRKPYFLFGDPRSPVHLWFADLSAPSEVQLWEARGSDDMTLSQGVAPEIRAEYEHGRWTATFKRSRSGPGVAFAEDTFVPIAFSVWDGFAAERGSKRGVTSWFDVYIPPMEQPSPWGPVLRTAGWVLGLELLVIGAVRWRRRRGNEDLGEDERA